MSDVTTTTTTTISFVKAFLNGCNANKCTVAKAIVWLEMAFPVDEHNDIVIERNVRHSHPSRYFDYVMICILWLAIWQHTPGAIDTHTAFNQFNKKKLNETSCKLKSYIHLYCCVRFLRLGFIFIVSLWIFYFIVFIGLTWYCIVMLCAELKLRWIETLNSS